jgi:LmbE family N-acetylglucosaminyl deacetylase
MTPALNGTPCDIFLLAHPDDDIFVRPVIRGSLRVSRRVVVIYLTNGAAGGRFAPSRRRQEALVALRSAGVRDDDIHFTGIVGDVPDGGLFDHLATSLDSILAALQGLCLPSRVISHAWEGGHPDHDAAHLLAIATARRLDCLSDSLAFPSYRTPDVWPLPFAVCKPLRMNGQRCDQRLSLVESLETLAALRHYRSQWVTFLGLGPGLAWQYCVCRSVPLQQLGMSSAPQRPTAKPLLAEKRFHVDWNHCARLATTFLSEHAGIT